MRRLLLPLAALLLGTLYPTVGGGLVAASAALASVPDQAGWTGAKRFVDLPNGQRVAYLDLGPREAPAVILLHGYTDSSRAWSLIAPPLAERRRLIVPDLRGHGASSKPTAGYTYLDIVGDVTSLADALEIERFDLIGHSMGSMVAQHVAAAQPQRVRHLVLVASTVLRPIEPDSALMRNLTGLTDPLDPSDPFIVDWLTQTELVPPNPAFTGRVKDEALLLPAHGWRQLAQNFAAGPVDADIARIASPVLLLSGARDPLFDSRHRAALDEAFPSGTHCVLAGGGHNLPYEAPAWTLARVMPFLADAGGDICRTG